MPPEDRLLQDLVKKVSKLEAELRRVASMQAGIGNFRLLGGDNGPGPAVTQDTTSAVMVDFGDSGHTSKLFTKKYEGTDLVFLYGITGFMITSTSSTFRFGFQIDGTDYGDEPWPITPISEFEHTANIIPVAGIPAGDFTAEMRIRRSAGTGAFRWTSSGNFWYLVLECPSSLTFS